MGRTILLVDDEKEFVKILSERLRFRGMDVRVAFSGREALEVLKLEVVDAVVLDVRMPGMDGMEALREIKKLTPRTPVLLLTGHASVEAAMEGMKWGASDYLIKPVDLRHLLEKLDKVCAGGRGAEAGFPKSRH
ncbi:MAG: response regulator [Desulfomonilaceae bacterium]|nr:response regulator [Desulfomonilaceae bacterium]